jgi:hypothetical protein
MISQATRRYELALPLFADLDVGALFTAQAQIKQQKTAGFSAFIAILAKSGPPHTIRKLAAIYGASDIELRQAEADPKVMAQLEERAADQPYAGNFDQAMDFFTQLLESLGATPDCSGASPDGAAAVGSPAAAPSAS